MCNSFCNHLNRYRIRYAVLSIQLILLVTSIVLTALGSVNSNMNLTFPGILILIIDSIWIIIYGFKLCCCPSTNLCCEENNWESYDQI